MSGTLTTGEFVEVHESMLPAGEMPHPPHKHPNSEFLFIQAGDLDYIDDDGSRIAVGPGDIVFSASNKMHGLKNKGTTPATYIVVSVSQQLPAG
jgi:XRE family transcriptional regulator, regulator of sulfur utilization